MTSLADMTNDAARICRMHKTLSGVEFYDFFPTVALSGIMSNELNFIKSLSRAKFSFLPTGTRVFMVYATDANARASDMLSANDIAYRRVYELMLTQQTRMRLDYTQVYSVCVDNSEGTFNSVQRVFVTSPAREIDLPVWLFGMCRASVNMASIIVFGWSPCLVLQTSVSMHSAINNVALNTCELLPGETKTGKRLKSLLIGEKIGPGEPLKDANVAIVFTNPPQALVFTTAHALIARINVSANEQVNPEYLSLAMCSYMQKMFPVIATQTNAVFGDTAKLRSLYLYLSVLLSHSLYMLACLDFAYWFDNAAELLGKLSVTWLERQRGLTSAANAIMTEQDAEANHLKLGEYARGVCKVLQDFLENERVDRCDDNMSVFHIGAMMNTRLWESLEWKIATSSCIYSKALASCLTLFQRYPEIFNTESSLFRQTCMCVDEAVTVNYLSNN